jgi:phage tail-like protein
MAEYRYPPLGFHFKVQFEGISGLTDNDTRFMEVSGLDATINVKSFREGGENRFEYAVPEGIKYGKLRLKRGMITDSGVTKWVRNTVENFDFQPVNILIFLLNGDHEPLQTWKVVGAYPTMWKTSDFKAMANEIVTEELELYYQYFKNI